ncbi:MAG: trimethylamine methyltransferase family protein, partial [Gammaproteobacteria bacterium]|nr:trimethylamine methyltransferase family protein [Gammaproteobacteria bacterium]
ATLALDAIREVGPGGHFFGSAHTMARYQDAFYSPLLSDWSNYETWQEAGSADSEQRASRIWKQLLREYRSPPLDAALDEALRDYVARRKRQIEKTD